MSSPQTINTVKAPSKDDAVITAAIIGLLAAIITAVIGAGASILGTIITIVAAKESKPKNYWQQIARDSGWIPRSECAWESIQATGKDKQGKSVTVYIKLLSGQYRWVYGSSTRAELGDEKIDLPSHIRGLEITPKSKIIVAVGMASVEGSIAQQSLLAEERTDKLSRLIQDELKPKIPVHGLSLGRYIDNTTKFDNSRATAPQRRVVVIEVVEQDEGAILKDAVYDALVEAKNATEPIPFDVTKYHDRKYTDHVLRR